MDMHLKYMQRCLQLAELGRYTCAPNPMVGCVVVYENRIIAEGWHYQAGMPHAERVALAKVNDDEVLKNSTLYVSLEPCSHYGRTPPCASLIIEKQIPKVVVASLDSNPLVAGKGIELLRSHGVEVIHGVLEQEARALNKKFYTYHEKKRPFIQLKWAQTADGFIAKYEEGKTKPLAISNSFSNRKVHMMRAEHEAILVGRNTAKLDNPKLDVRHVSGKNPLRLVIDRSLMLPHSLQLLSDDKPTWILNQQQGGQQGNKTFKRYNMSDWAWLHDLMDDLYQAQIQSLLVEGGAEVLQAFISAHLWDEATVITALNKSIGMGVKAPTISNSLIQEKNLVFGDEWLKFKNVF